jgi:ATP-binding cassette subfamily C protein
MINQTTAIDLPGQLFEIHANQPSLLKDPQTVWWVKSGSIAVFAVTVRNKTIEGTRRYLFSVAAGEVLFGTATSFGKHQQMLAVPVGEVELVKVDREYLMGLIAAGDPIVNSLINNWLRQIETAVAHVNIPAIQVKARGKSRFSLSDGQTFQGDRNTIALIKIQEGKMRWLGFSELTLTDATEIFPLSDRMWLEAEGNSQFITQTITEIKDLDLLLNGLSQLHTYLFHSIELLEQQEIEEERQRLRDRDRLNSQVTTEALVDLASALRSKEALHLLEGTPLFVVANAVGNALGVRIRPPSRSDDLKRFKDPLEAIARASRLRMRRVLLRGKWWEEDCGPLIAYIPINETETRPVALLPVSATRYELFDPVTKTRVPVNEKQAFAVDPVAYMFYRSLPDRSLKALEIIGFALKGRGKDIFTIIVTGIVATLLGMLTPQATGILIDNAIPDSDRGLLMQVGLGLLAAAFGTAIFQLAQGFALVRLETVADISTQAAVWDRLLNLPVSFFRRYTTGDLQSRVSSISSVRQQLSGTTIINLTSGLFALLNLGLLFYYNVKLALVAVAVAVVTVSFTSICGIFLLRKVRPMLEVKGEIFGQTVQLINGISKLRVAGAEERAFAAWSKNYSRQIKLELGTQFIQDIVTLFNTLMPTITSALLFWFTIQLLTESQTKGEAGFTIGTFMAFNSAFGIFIKGATDVSNTFTQILQVVPQWKRAQPILEAIPEVDLRKADPGRLMGRITLDRLTFRYREDGPLILNDVSIYADPGEFIALVGGSGSGKSTLLRLLLGFEIPHSGAIFYDGQDMSGLDIEAVRRQMGVVLQSGRIMSSSIFENIASGAQIKLDEAWEAARMAGFADDIAAMPMEMHTVISEGGGNLSGGQRQRLLIARALALKPRILLFDEATSALDNKTQAIVSASLDRLQVTRIVIAHRLSTIRNAHRIYVLQSGKIAQQGNFDELASATGLFAQLMARQIT